MLPYLVGRVIKQNSSDGVRTNYFVIKEHIDERGNKRYCIVNYGYVSGEGVLRASLKA